MIYNDIKHVLKQFCFQGRFQDVEEQKEVAAVLHARIKLESQEDRQQALIDVMFRMKEDSLKKRTSELAPNDSEVFMKLLKEKKDLEELRTRKQKLHISFE